MGAAGCRMAKVRPENGSPRSSLSSDEESSDVPVARNQGDPMRQRRKRVVVHHNANVCKFCPNLLNIFNTMEGGVCAACAKVVFRKYEDLQKHSSVAIMENAGQVFQVLDQAYRVKKFMSGVDELRDKYFDRKVVTPWIKEENRLKNEALVGGD